MNALALLCLLAGQVPDGFQVSAGFVVTNRVPAAKSACDCARTGVCTCVGVCPCGPDGYTAIIARAEREGLPVVIFAGVPKRVILGASVVAYPELCSLTRCYKHNILVGSPKANGSKTFDMTVLPATATDAQILAAGKEPVQQSAYSSPSGTHRHQDSQGHIWQHGNQNVGHTAPHVSPWTGEVVFPRYYGPKAPERVGGLSALPMFAANCPT